MPAVTSGKILVTGASGFIGAWVVKYLVEHHYSVVVAVRSPSDIGFITKRFPEYEGKVSGLVVPNIETVGAYDTAMEDVDGIIHVASPVTHTWEDPSEVISPAVNGAIGILTSAAKLGKNVKRVVFTSSSSAVSSKDGAERKLYNEMDWNDASAKLVEEQGKNASPFTVYNASKALAERATWDFMKREAPEFDLVTILPTYNLGPYIHEASEKRRIGTSLEYFLSTLPKGGDTSGIVAANWVDVRDAALHHVLALSTPEAGGERISSSAGPYAWQDVYDILNDAGYHNIPGKATYGKGKSAIPTRVQDNSKSLRVFSNFTYRSLSESVRDMGESLARGGFL